MSRALLLLAAAGCFTACGLPTETCAAGGDLTGNWRYSALQAVPAGTTLSGTLAITSQHCGSFTGQLDVVQTTPQGGSQRIGGPVSGRVIDAGSIRFDAVLGALPRQHLAAISGDSLSGTWLVVDGAGQSLSGTFGSKREAR